MDIGRPAESEKRNGRPVKAAVVFYLGAVPPPDTKSRPGEPGRPRARLSFPGAQFGTLMTPDVTVIVFAAAGAVEIFGTLAAVIAGADPGVPPRGVVCTT